MIESVVLSNLSLIGYVLSAGLAFFGTRWWKAALVGGFIQFIVSFIVEWFTGEPETAGLLLLLLGPAIIFVLPMLLLINAVIAYAAAWLGKKMGCRR